MSQTSSPRGIQLLATVSPSLDLVVTPDRNTQTPNCAAQGVHWIRTRICCQDRMRLQSCLWMHWHVSAVLSCSMLRTEGFNVLSTIQRRMSPSLPELKASSAAS